MSDHDAYEVGYKKPPQETRFKKGQSGNPKGRTAGKANTSTLLDAALRATVTIVEDGRRVKKPKLEVAFTQVANKAASGDLKAVGILMRMLPLLDPKQAEALVTADMVTDRDLARKIAQRLAARALGAAAPNQNGGENHDAN